jgi:hypothetical protein
MPADTAAAALYNHSHIIGRRQQKKPFFITKRIEK